eukprot:COSAG06_NODE_24712_length_654_cov_5.431607_2_plen_28_part_01
MPAHRALVLTEQPVADARRMEAVSAGEL